MKKSVVTLLHIGFWLMYLLLLILIVSIPAQFSPKTHEMAPQLGPIPIQRLVFSCILMSAFSIIPGVISFYSFYTFLFSRFFVQKRIFLLCLYGILISVASGLIGTLIVNISINALGKEGSPEISGLIAQTFAITVNAIACGIIGLVMKGFITSYGDIKLKADLSKKNHEMELALLKSQINPHFLFNTINNIDVLIEKDAVKASAYLNKLSDIMRFTLYETKEEKIALTRELTYIERYIDLQRIRTSNPTYVNYAVEGEPGNLMIAPMLFIPFIENTFKHTENKKIENAINIKVTIEKDKITFECKNAYSTDSQTKLKHGGLGNELIQKRLMLLYPRKHTLKITNENNTYNVNLIINGN
jgi:two-component system LytT family sensor kinase